MPGLVAQEFHAPAWIATFHFQHKIQFQLFELRVGKKERDRDTGYAVRAIPLIGKPEVRTETNVFAFQLEIQSPDLWFNRAVFQPQAQIADTHIE